MRNILVTGGAGFIGSNFVRYWANQHPEDKLIILDALTYAANLKNIESIRHTHYKFFKGDILDRSFIKNVFNEHQINTVVHFAAETHVDRSIQNPEIFINTNIVGTQILLEIASHAWRNAKNKVHFHHISTDEVYGSLTISDSPRTEESSYAPNSPYAASKAASNHLVRSYYKTYQLPATISNCSNNYGPYQHSEKLIPTIINFCLKDEPIPIYGDGSNIRDWLHVEDHCLAIDLILQKGKVGETYNIGGRTEINNLTLVKLICDMMDNLRPMRKSYQSLISFVADRAGHDWRYAVDTFKIYSELNFVPRIDFKSGLLNTVKYYLEELSHHKISSKEAIR